MIAIYGIKSCGSVKKALTFFQTHGLEYTFHDFKATPVDDKKIAYWNTFVPIEILLNSKGTTYKTLELKKLELTQQEKIVWMAKHNLLIKRPVIEFNDNVTVGFDESHYKGLFLS